jgi:4-amino-4-deoxychorismate lyase
MKFVYNATQYDQDAAVISPYDHGFLYGMGVFETFRTYAGKPFLFAHHLDRLTKSLAMIGIRWQPDLARLATEISELMQANHVQEAYVRLSVSAGVAPLGLPTEEYMKPNELILMKALPEATITETPAKAVQLLATKRLAPETDVRIKSFHYMNNILGKQEMFDYPWATGAEGLMVTEQGDVAEGLTSNIFIVKNGVLYTPPLDTGILPGVTRQFIFELADKLAVPVKEQRFKWGFLLQADEVFLTNSVQAIVPVHLAYNPDGDKYQFAEQRQVTQQFQKLYEVFVQRGEW